MNYDSGDVLRLGESGVLPGSAGIRRDIHAIAVISAAGDGIVSGSDPDDVCIGWRHGNRAHRSDPDTIGDRLEGRSVVGSLPHASGTSGSIECALMRFGGRFRNGNVYHPCSGAKGAQVPIGERVQDIRVCGIGRKNCYRTKDGQPPRT
jgi:hypothetical protein